MVVWEGKQANSQVCLLWYSAMLDAMVGPEAKCMFACVGIARCKTLWLGGKQERQTRKLACFGVARWKRYGWAGSKAGKLACLPALEERDATRYGWVGKKAGKLQGCLPWYSTRQDAMVGREQSRQTRKFACKQGPGSCHQVSKHKSKQACKEASKPAPKPLNFPKISRRGSRDLRSKGKCDARDSAQPLLAA